jgi:pimeloyl-ACP methyl ester carboxylesterase
MFAENVRGLPSRYPGHGRELADGYEETFAFLDRMHQEALVIFRALGPADLQRRCETPGGASLAVWKYVVPHTLWDEVRPKLRNQTFHLFERSGHTPQLEEPELFDRVLLEWIQEGSL